MPGTRSHVALRMDGAGFMAIVGPAHAWQMM
jgi:hypothetical protein